MNVDNSKFCSSILEKFKLLLDATLKFLPRELIRLLEDYIDRDVIITNTMTDYSPEKKIGKCPCRRCGVYHLLLYDFSSTKPTMVRTSHGTAELLQWGTSHDIWCRVEFADYTMENYSPCELLDASIKDHILFEADRAITDRQNEERRREESRRICSGFLWDAHGIPERFRHPSYVNHAGIMWEAGDIVYFDYCGIFGRVVFLSPVEEDRDFSCGDKGILTWTRPPPYSESRFMSYGWENFTGSCIDYRMINSRINKIKLDEIRIDSKGNVCKIGESKIGSESKIDDESKIDESKIDDEKYFYNLYKGELDRAKICKINSSSKKERRTERRKKARKNKRIEKKNIEESKSEIEKKNIEESKSEIKNESDDNEYSDGDGEYGESPTLVPFSTIRAHRSYDYSYKLHYSGITNKQQHWTEGEKSRIPVELNQGHSWEKRNVMAMFDNDFQHFAKNCFDYRAIQESKTDEEKLYVCMIRLLFDFFFNAAMM